MSNKDSILAGALEGGFSRVINGIRKDCFSLAKGSGSPLQTLHDLFMKDLNFGSLYKITVFLVFATILFFILIVGQGILVPLVISFFIAFLLIPLANFLERIRFPRVLSAITSVIIAVVVLVALFTFFGSQINRFSNDLDDIKVRVKEIKQDLPDVIQDQLEGYSTDEILAYAQENMGAIFSGLTGFIGGFTFVFIVPIYIALILIYRDQLRNFLLMVFDNRKLKPTQPAVPVIGDSEGIKDLIPKIRLIIQKYIVGMFYVIVILFILYSAALLSLGIKHAILFAAIASLLNIIPFVGPFLGSALPILFALVTKDSLFYPVAVLGAFIVIQSVEGNFLTPKIVGNNVSLNPLITLITLFVGAAVWGVAGMILFIPIVAVIKEILGSIDGLEPYAYLLGTGEEKVKKPGLMARMFGRLRGPRGG